MGYIYTVEYYSVVKINNVLKFICKWLKLEETILSEVGQTQKVEHGMYVVIG